MMSAFKRDRVAAKLDEAGFDATDFLDQEGLPDPRVGDDIVIPGPSSALPRVEAGPQPRALRTIEDIENSTANHAAAAIACVQRLEAFVERLIGHDVSQPPPQALIAEDIQGPLLSKTLLHCDSLHVSLIRLAKAIDQIETIG